MQQGTIVKVAGPLIVAEGMKDATMYDVVRVEYLINFYGFHWK